MAMSHDSAVPTDLASVAGQARVWRQQLLALSSTPDYGAPIRNALGSLATALEAITAAKSKVALIVTNPSYAVEYKLNQARQLVGDAYSEATRAVLDLTGAIDKARTKLATSSAVRKPAGADAMTAFQAEQVTKLLEHAGSSGAVINTVAKLLDDALAREDAALVWVLAGGPLQVVYDRLGVNAPMMQARLAEVLAKAEAQPTDAAVSGRASGAALAAALERGGSGTLRGLVDVARLLVNREQTAYNIWLMASARVGAMNGITSTWDSSAAPAR